MPSALARVKASCIASALLMIAPRRLVTPLIPVSSQRVSLVPVICAPENCAALSSQSSNLAARKSASPKSA